MEIGYFREFVILAETQNFWAAAERLFISQSALSKHIKSMEKQLGAPLLERNPRKMELTEFGKLVLPYAQSVARLQYEYESATFSYLNQENEPLHIATIPVIAHYNITDVLVEFQLQYPTIPFDIEEADTLEVREWLLEHKCHLGIFRDSAKYLEHDPDKEAQLIKIPYCQDYLVAVLPADHPLAGEKQVALSQLSTEYFALIQQGTMPYKLCMRACREAGFTPRVLLTSHRLETILDMVRKGSCIALMFSRQVAFHLSFPTQTSPNENPPFVAIPVAPEIQTTICLGYLQNAVLSPGAAHFIEYWKLAHFH
ncbi:MAG: LysR family transcriptional regulator [Candidatus Onthomonas sp.]